MSRLEIAPALPAPRESRKTVLLVARDRHSEDRLTELLAGAGYDVLATDSGEKSLRLARSAQPDLILLEPTARLELLDRLRADEATRHIPVVVAGRVAGPDRGDPEGEGIAPAGDPADLLAHVRRLAGPS